MPVRAQETSVLPASSKPKTVARRFLSFYSGQLVEVIEPRIVVFESGLHSNHSSGARCAVASSSTQSSSSQDIPFLPGTFRVGPDL